MRIEAQAQAIQFLQAQQAFASRRAQAAPPEAQQPAPLPSAEPESAPLNLVGSLARSPQWCQTVREVSEIANRAGYLGLSETDIQRAYVTGESLLADYRV